MSVLPAHHPQPGVGRCGFCEHYRVDKFKISGTCGLDDQKKDWDFGHCEHFVGNPCDCEACGDLRGLHSHIYVLCPTCGNKRCPKASNHELECTGSNEPGQEGSVYK